MTAYRELEQRFRRLGAIEQAISVLHWDTAAIMPAGGAAARAEQLATLRLIAHQHLVASEIEALLAEADAASDELGEWQRANLREMRRRWLHATAVPGALVEAESRACSECEAVWRRGRLENDFAAVLPGLERIIHIEREIAAVKAERLGKSSYEALLDQYEPDASVAEIDRLFDEIAEFLPDLIEAALSRQAALPSAPVCGPFPIETQRRIAMRLMERIGFDFAHGRLDISAHPFCGGTPEDVRITTRYDEDDFARALMGVLHETGHALYQRGLPAEWRLQPVGRARGMAMHESQSLLLEMQVCRSRAFLTYAAPIIRKAFGGDGPEWEVEALYRRPRFRQVGEHARAETAQRLLLQRRVPAAFDVLRQPPGSAEHAIDERERERRRDREQPLAAQRSQAEELQRRARRQPVAPRGEAEGLERADRQGGRHARLARERGAQPRDERLVDELERGKPATGEPIGGEQIVRTHGAAGRPLTLRRHVALLHAV